MQGNKLDGLRVAILVSTDFEQAELTEPKKRLSRLELLRPSLLQSRARSQE